MDPMTTIMRMPTRTRMITDPSTARLTLLQWVSPAFPVSAFAYSHGLETVIADGRIKDAQSLERWVWALLDAGSGRTDGTLLSLACRRQMPLADIAELAEALAASRERWEETRDMGGAFLRTTESLGSEPLPDLPYPVAFGARAAALNLPVTEILATYLHGFAANLIAVAVRFVPLGQTEGQQVLAGLGPRISALAEELADAGPEDIRSSVPAADMAALQHETLDVRLFKT